jgi:hypothetical protein
VRSPDESDLTGQEEKQLGDPDLSTDEFFSVRRLTDFLLPAGGEPATRSRISKEQSTPDGEATAVNEGESNELFSFRSIFGADGTDNQAMQPMKAETNSSSRSSWFDTSGLMPHAAATTNIKSNAGTSTSSTGRSNYSERKLSRADSLSMGITPPRASSGPGSGTSLERGSKKRGIVALRRRVLLVRVHSARGLRGAGVSSSISGGSGGRVWPRMLAVRCEPAGSMRIGVQHQRASSPAPCQWPQNSILLWLF